MKSYRFRILVIALLCFTGFYGNAQVPTWNWANHNNVAHSDFINIVSDQNGYIYASVVDDDGTVLSKYKPSGIKIWSKTDTSTRVQKLSIDAAGNLYITAASHSFGGTSIFTARLDSAGNRLWTKGIFTIVSPTDGPTGALFTGAADAAGNTYMSGAFKSLANFDTISLSNLAADNYFLAKYNSAGKIQWIRFFNYPVYAIACGPQDSYFLECGTHFQKYAANGTLIWQQSFSGLFDPSIHLFTSNKFIGDAQGNLYVLGNKLAKYNSNGTLAWARTPGGAGFSLTNAGNIVVTGSFNNNLALGNGVPNLTAGAAGSLFTAQFSGADGSANWAKQANAYIPTSTGSIYGEAITSIQNGNYAVAGNFKGGCTFDQLSLTGKGVFVAKLSGNALGIAENKTTSSFQLYPNPSNSEVTISNSGFRNATVEIYNVAGQKIYHARTNDQSSLSVSTENWPNGIYAVKILSDGKSITKKLIVSH